MCGTQADHAVWQTSRPYRTPSFDCTANLGRHFGGGILAVIVLTVETEASELADPAPKQPPKGRGLASGSGARGARADCSIKSSFPNFEPLFAYGKQPGT